VVEAEEVMAEGEVISKDKPLTKKTIDALGKVFLAEINGQLPFQSRAKIYSDLCAEGLLKKTERKFGSGWSAVKVYGFELTHAGRIAYCATCEDEDA
jgi:hypothetical protein